MLKIFELQTPSSWLNVVHVQENTNCLMSEMPRTKAYPSASYVVIFQEVSRHTPLAPDD